MFSTAREIFDDLTQKLNAEQIQSLFVPFLLSVLIERENSIRTKYTQIQNTLPVFASVRMTLTEMMLGDEPNPTTEKSQEEGDIVFTISPATVDALKHFHRISMFRAKDKIPSGLLIHPGNRLRAMERGRHVMGEYLSDDEFPCELAISHIDRLVVMLDAENGSKVIVRKDECLDGALIIDGNRFPLADKEFLTYPDIEFPRPKTPTVSFLLTAEKITKIIRDARTLDISELFFLNNDDNNIISVIVDTRMLYESFRATDVICASTTTVDFCVWLDVDYLKLLPDSDFIVSITNESGIIFFDSVDSRYTYYMGRGRAETLPTRWEVLNFRKPPEPKNDKEGEVTELDSEDVTFCDSGTRILYFDNSVTQRQSGELNDGWYEVGIGYELIKADKENACCKYDNVYYVKNGKVCVYYDDADDYSYAFDTDYADASYLNLEKFCRESTGYFRAVAIICDIIQDKGAENIQALLETEMSE